MATLDPDHGDSHSYEIVGGHPLFEINGDTITLKAGAQLDYETQNSYDLEIRSTDGAGNSIVKTVTVNVTDVNEAPTELQAALSPAAENAQAGTVVGQLATLDPDHGDSHSYEIVGGHPLFEIDGDTITLKPGAQLDYETQNSYDLEIRSTDGAGNSIVKTVTVNVTDVNETPDATTIAGQTATAGEGFSLDTSSHFSDVDQGDTLTYSIDGPEWLSIDPHTGVISGTPPAHLALQELTSGSDGGYEVPPAGVVQLSTEMFGNWAGYSNSFGFYVADATAPRSAVPWSKPMRTRKGSTRPSSTLPTILARRASASSSFPMAAQNSALGDGEQIEFQFADGEWHAVGGRRMSLTGTGPGVCFSNPALNSDGTDHLQDNNHNGNQNWEDLFGGGDNSFADVNAQITLSLVQAVPDAADVPVTVTVTDSGGLTVHSSFDLNVQPSPVTIDDIENHTYDPTGSVVDAGPTDILLGSPDVAENSTAGTVVGHLSSTDANLSDSHSYEIVNGHPLFEISGDTITLKAGAQLDYETQNSYDLEIRSTDEAGNSVVKTVTVNVTDVNEAPDATAVAAQTATAGEGFSLDTSSHFSDVDHGDSLTYSIDGPEWLSIDPHTGVISGTPPGHMAAQELIAGGNGHYALPPGGVLQLSTDILSSNAGYSNSVGYYLADAQGNPLGGAIVEDNAHNLGESLALIDLAEYPGAATFGFFIIPNGNQNAASIDGQKVEFQLSGGQWHASANGVQLTGTGAGVFFSDASLNAKGFDYLVDNGSAGNHNWEDLLNGGDKDFDDVNAQVSLKVIQLVPDTDHATVTVTVTDSGGLTAQSSFDLNIQPDGQPGIYEILGTDHAENVYGTEQSDTISALGGNDVVYAYGGNDTVLGGDGNDALYGEAGNDTLDGGIGDDTLDGGDGNDMLTGGSGADKLYGGAGADTLDGGDGNDLLESGDGNDTLAGGAGIDKLYGGAGDDALDGGEGDDLLDGGDGNDMLTGGAGADKLYGGAGADALDGGDGNDALYGGDGNDSSAAARATTLPISVRATTPSTRPMATAMMATASIPSMAKPATTRSGAAAATTSCMAAMTMTTSMARQATTRFTATPEMTRSTATSATIR